MKAFLVYVIILTMTGSALARIPEAGAAAELGAGQLFASIPAQQRWELHAGGSQPWSTPSYGRAFVKTDIDLKNARLGAGFTYSQLDSIFSSTLWEFEGTARWRTFFSGFRHEEELHLIPGLPKQWIRRNSVLLGASPGESIRLALGASYESPCISGQVAIQWRLGNFYRMNIEIEKPLDQPMGITFGQQLALDSLVLLATGIQFPQRMIGAGFVFSSGSLWLDATQIWHTLLAPSRFASVAWRSRD